MSRKSFPNPSAYQQSGAVGLSKQPPTYEDGYDYPVFCLKHLHRDYDIDSCIRANSKFIKSFAKRLKVLSDLTWTQIQLSDRHGHGAEKIAKASINPSVPTSITRDVKDFLSFCFSGTDGRIVGYRDSNIFHIVYIDTDLSVYDH